MATIRDLSNLVECFPGLKINSRMMLTARLYPEEDPSRITEVDSYVDGLYVSDFPMTTASLYMNYEYELSSGSTLIFNPVYSLFSRYYAVFNPDAKKLKP